MIHLYYTYSVSKLPYRRAFISATSNREFPPDFLKNFVVLNKYVSSYLANAKSRTFTFKKFMI